MKVVVDASVALKWFVEEIHSAAAARLLDPELVILAPDLIGAEISNALWKKVRRREISAGEASQIMNAMAGMNLQIHPSANLLISALELAIAIDRTVYDCLYLTLAIAQDCTLITADRKVHACVAATPFAGHIRWIEDE